MNHNREWHFNNEVLTKKIECYQMTKIQSASDIT